MSLFMKVPLLDLQAQYAPLRAEILAAIERVCDSQRSPSWRSASAPATKS
jgi:hypothetical protein